jgi:hypothetical protein
MSMAATGTDSRGDQFYGPRRTVGGPPALQEMWAPMQHMDDATRVWDVSERLVSARTAS